MRLPWPPRPPFGRIFTRFQDRADILTKMRAFERQTQPISPREGTAAGVDPSRGAAATVPWPGSSCSLPATGWPAAMRED